MRLFAPLFCSVAFALGSCGPRAANEFPATARAQFDRSCPAGEPMCECTWDQLTRTMTHEEYVSALDRYRTEGLMDPRVTRARTHCLERHPS